jgi:hypothetical protein
MSSGNNRMNAIALGVGQRTAAWLRQKYPDAKAKRIARDFGVAKITAKGWLKGNRPSNDHWDLMVARWKKEFLAFVYSPTFDWAENLRLEVEIETIQARLDVVSEKVKARNAADQNDPRDHRAVARRETGEASPVVDKARREDGR